VSVCPPEAIYEDADVPEPLRAFIAINREFFSPAVTALGSPAGASSVGAALRDHPTVAGWTATPGR
jgi:ferredoxin